MDVMKKEKNEEIEIDLGRVFRAVMDRAWLVIVVSVICAAVTFAVTFFFVTPQYKAAAMFYVNNNSLSVGDASLSISSGDLVTSRGLVDSYIVILNTRETLTDVIDYAGTSRTYSEIKGMISAEAVNETIMAATTARATTSVTTDAITRDTTSTMADTTKTMTVLLQRSAATILPNEQGG